MSAPHESSQNLPPELAGLSQEDMEQLVQIRNALILQRQAALGHAAVAPANQPPQQPGQTLWNPNLSSNWPAQFKKIMSGLRQQGVEPNRVIVEPSVTEYDVSGSRVEFSDVTNYAGTVQRDGWGNAKQHKHTAPRHTRLRNGQGPVVEQMGYVLAISPRNGVRKYVGGDREHLHQKTNPVSHTELVLLEDGSIITAYQPSHPDPLDKNGAPMPMPDFQPHRLVRDVDLNAGRNFAKVVRYHAEDTIDGTLRLGDPSFQGVNAVEDAVSEAVGAQYSLPEIISRFVASGGQPVIMN